MSKFVGFEPKPKTSKIAEDFENKVIIRRDNHILLGKVFADIMESEWNVALGYNQTLNPGIHGMENDFEVRYTYEPSGNSPVKRLGTDTGDETEFTPGEFITPDEFIIWALGQEKAIQLSSA